MYSGVPFLASIVAILITIPSSAARELRGSTSSDLVCRVTMAQMKYESPNVFQRTVYECTPENGDTDLSYPFELPESVAQDEKQALEAGTLVVSIPGGHIESSRVVVPENAVIRTMSSSVSANQADEKNANRDVLVLRVSTNDATLENSAEELSLLLFGKGTLSADTAQGKQFQWEASEHNVLDISLDLEARTSTSYQLANAASIDAKTILGVEKLSDAADHIMICLPPGTGNWIAYAGSNHYRSVYNSRWCSHQKGVLHELSYNVGLK